MAFFLQWQDWCDTSHVFHMNLYRFVVRITLNSWLWPWVMRTKLLNKEILHQRMFVWYGWKLKDTVSVSIYYIVIHIYICVYRDAEKYTLWHEIWVRTWDTPYQLGSWNFFHQTHSPKWSKNYESLAGFLCKSGHINEVDVFIFLISTLSSIHRFCLGKSHQWHHLKDGGS